jgi:hypothetical protein
MYRMAQKRAERSIEERRTNYNDDSSFGFKLKQEISTITVNAAA